MRASVLVLIALSACANPDFDPRHPDFRPIHDLEQDGAFHVKRFKQPFCCGNGSVTSADNTNDKIAACPTDGVTFPSPFDQSCDASGCHGTFDYSASPKFPRSLTGANGPSCFTCHGDVWEKDCL